MAWPVAHLAFTQDGELTYTWVFSPEPGFDPRPFIGKTDRDLYPPPIAERLALLKKKAIDGGALKAELALDLEERLIVELMIAPDEKGGLVGSMMDVSERAHQRDKARGSLRDLRSLLESQDILFALLDSERKIRVASAGAKTKVREVFGIELEGGDCIDAFLPQEALPQVLEAFPLVFGGQRFEVETVHDAVDGTVRSFLLNFTPVTAILGPINGVLLMARETTAQRRAEEAQRDSERQLHHGQRLESLGMLAAGVAHDFNNLLVGVLSNAESVLEDSALPAPFAEPVQDIKAAAQRAADLTRQLLAYAGKAKPAIERVDLNRLVNEMAQLLRINLPKGAHFQLDLAAMLPAIEADRTQVQQIVMNLISNAAEAVDQTGTVRLTTRSQLQQEPPLGAIYRAPWAPGEHVILEVADDGLGMSPEIQGRIFDPFFTTKFSGRGLGLSSVLGIVHAHQGAVKVDSAAGRGTKMTVLLPVSQQVPEPNPRPILDANGGAAKIMVVDDDPGVRKALARQLGRLGYECETLDDGSTALARLGERSGDAPLMILDRTMPGLSGEEVLAEVRLRYPNIKVLMISGFVGPSPKSGDPQPDAFLHKPFTTADLDAELRRLLSEDDRDPRGGPPP